VLYPAELRGRPPLHLTNWFVWPLPRAASRRLPFLPGPRRSFTRRDDRPTARAPRNPERGGIWPIPAPGPASRLTPGQDPAGYPLVRLAVGRPGPLIVLQRVPWNRAFARPGIIRRAAIRRVELVSPVAGGRSTARAGIVRARPCSIVRLRLRKRHGLGETHKHGNPNKVSHRYLLLLPDSNSPDAEQLPNGDVKIRII
jgi:hypothetical protein